VSVTKVDTSTRPLWMLSASELSIAYGNGLRPTDVVEATLNRIDEVNPALNAIVTLDADGARRAAEASTQRWRSGNPTSALDGVPISIKDNILVAGLRATWGSRLYADFIPTTDELPVQRLRDGGAVILGKTNVPEFTVHGFTHNRLFGTTGNPWNTALTPGGSSGGAVAAVSTGMGAIALCTDGGGSIRRPAAHTGLIGLKPSRGMVPRGTGFPAILGDFEVAGPVARCVGDLLLAMDVIAGPKWRETQSLSPVASARIAYAPTFGDAPVDPLIRNAVDGTIEQLRLSGHRVTTIQPFTLAVTLDRIWPVISQTGVAWLLSQHACWQDLVAPEIADMEIAGAGLAATDYLAALDAISTMRGAFEALFEQHDFLVTPTTAAMPWPAREPHPRAIDGKTVGPRGHAVFTPVANALGLPAISLPCPVETGAMPIGFQVFASWDRDRRLLDFAQAFEPRSGRYQWPPR
jgi:aspartyl-tRNA(Asn)/glutamyl-tRNA(Gln) amidotransferase subunit A